MDQEPSDVPLKEDRPQWKSSLQVGLGPEEENEWRLWLLYFRFSTV